jgi:valyl-tRNA synthetase
MVCTFGDKMDVIWQNRYKLPIIEVINSHGKMQNSGPIDGLKVEEARKKILEILGDKVFKKESTNQVVKVHDRCKTPIELISSFQWFADIRTTSKHIKNFANKIKWHPDFGISYLVDWVENAEWDWVISRQRVFGTPLPFYYCECGKTATADDSDLPFYPEKAKQKLCDCGRPMHAETSTCDCWVDSSITPLIIAGWPDDEAQFSRLYPASLRPQGVEIVRTWAFYTIHRSGLLTSQAPFKEILLNGNVLAPDGKKMSKSLGNVISPSELLRDYPADAIRQWAALSGAMAKDRPFSYEDIKYAKSFISKIWNSAKFIETIGKYEGKEIPKLTKIDRWIIGRLNSTIKDCNEHMEKFEFHYAITKIQRFFWQDFCDNYIEYIKHRTYNQGPTTDAAKYCVNRVLMDTVHLLAPITPHLSEEIYKQLYGQIGSIHTSSYPVAGDLYEEDTATIEMFNELVKLIRQHKAKNKIAQNGELELVRLSTQSELDQELVSEMMAICKIKKVEQIRGEIGVNI